jgi:hypothetical protein
MSQPGIGPGTSCTAGKYFIKEPLERLYLDDIRDLTCAATSTNKSYIFEFKNENVARNGLNH